MRPCPHCLAAHRCPSGCALPWAPLLHARLPGSWAMSCPEPAGLSLRSAPWAWGLAGAHIVAPWCTPRLLPAALDAECVSTGTCCNKLLPARAPVRAPVTESGM